MYKLLFLTVFISAFSFGQGFQVNLQGQQQQGMGAAGSALMQDASSLFFNPGGASFVHGNQVNLGMTPTIANGTFLEKNTNEMARTTSPVGTPFFAYGLFQIKDSSRLKLGIAFYTPFGSTVEWEEEWSGRFALTRLQLLSIFCQPTVSFRLSDRIGIGAGFVYSYGKVNLQKDIPLMDQNNEFASAELDGTSHGYGYNVGLYIEPTDHVGFAVTYRSQVNMELSQGTATFNVPASIEDKFPSGNFTSSLPLPQVFTLGLSIKPNKKLAIALDVNYVGWKAYDTLAFDYENNTETLVDTKSPRNYENIIAVRIGGQYKFKHGITGRIGFAFGISPIQKGYVTPESSGNNRVNYTAGIGYKLSEKFILDASILYTQVSREDTNLETGLSGTYKTSAFAPGLSLTYKF